MSLIITRVQKGRPSKYIAEQSIAIIIDLCFLIQGNPSVIDVIIVSSVANLKKKTLII